MSDEMEAMTPFDGFNEPTDLGMPLPAHGGSDAPKPVGLMAQLHRTLRGRYWIVVPLALILGGVGGFFGWRSQKPIYKSDGAVQLQYQIEAPFEGAKGNSFFNPIPLYEDFLSTQVLFIMSRRNIDMALQEPAWQETGRGNDLKTMMEFIDNITVEHPKQTQTIHVAYNDRDPGVAAAAVKATLRAYEKMYTAGDKKIEQNKLDALKKGVDDLKTLMNVEKSAINEIASQFGNEDFEPLYANKVAQVNQLETQLNAAKLAMTLQEGRGEPSKMIDGLTVGQIGMLDQIMRDKIMRKAEAQTLLDRLLIKFGDRHPDVQQARRQLESSSGDVEQYAKEYRDLQKKLAQNGGTATGGGIGPALAMSTEALKTEVGSLTKMYDEANAAMVDTGNKLREVRKHQERIKDFNEQLKGFEKDRGNLNLQAFADSRLKVISYGDVPAIPFKDKRKTMAGLCGLGGVAFPILLFALIGYMDKRYRFSDEADSADMPPLLGILPTLPDRLSDPEQASIAAHCIHQLRIMLQVNGGPERKTYMITSASAGDGKTSLTMALGLSFAASGSRTLVIDCDMIGQGLTNRLKARQSQGLLEALGAGTLQGRVKKTTTHNLYILPIGGADAAHAGSISPLSIRKLLADGRKIFDIIIIDTGPILGSLEAAVVGAAVDGVMLTIARGQHQPLVERSVRQLRQVGANILGLVFNRAEKRDFQRSVASSSIRSITAGPQPQRMLLSDSADESRFGPLARSVASFMPGNPELKQLAAKTEPRGESKGDAKNEIRVEVISQVAANGEHRNGEHGNGDHS